MTRLRNRAELLDIVPAADERAAEKVAIEAFARTRTAAESLRWRKD
jgi:hypothetical protein